MKTAAADPVAKPPGESWDSAPPLPRASWSPKKLVVFILFAFVAHVALIWIFGAKQFPAPRPVSHVPQLELADDGNELIALDDPTLFILPHANDFVTVFWQRPPEVAANSFRWIAPTNWLLPPVEHLGSDFHQFMQTNPPVRFVLNFKPPPLFTEIVVPTSPGQPPASALRITGDLAQRALVKAIHLPLLPCNDVLPPSRVQALVDAAGNVVSIVLLETGGFERADTNALALARAARFVPATNLTLGEMIFQWHTVPEASTNSPKVP